MHLLRLVFDVIITERFIMSQLPCVLGQTKFCYNNAPHIQRIILFSFYQVSFLFYV